MTLTIELPEDIAQMRAGKLRTLEEVDATVRAAIAAGKSLRGVE